MLRSLCKSEKKKKSNICLLCFENFIDIKSHPDTCNDLFHYKCLRIYVDKRIEDEEPIICPGYRCNKFFSRIANRYENSDEILYQNVIISNDEITCCICFSKYQSPVASSDSCSHTFCYECIKKWCTFKHECPMDRMPIKMLLISDFPGGHIKSKLDPPAIDQDLNADAENDEIGDTTCEVCNSGQDEHQLLLCDNCNRGYHMYCLSEPLHTIPEGDWFCHDCRSHNTISEDTSVVIGRRLPRGLGRVIFDLQDRLNRNNTTSNRERIRNSILSRTRSRVVSAVEADSGLRSGLRQRTNVEQVRETLRVRPPAPTRPIRNNIEMESQTYSSDLDSTITRSSVTDSGSLSTSTELEEPTNVRSRRRQMLNRCTNLNISHGSLSSDIESDQEPNRKRKKFDYSSSSSESSLEESESESTSEEEVDSSKKKIIITRSKLNKSVKSPKKVKDDSEGDNKDDDDKVFNTCKQKRRLIFESESGDDNRIYKATSSKLRDEVDDIVRDVCCRNKLQIKQKKTTKKLSVTKVSALNKRKLSLKASKKRKIISNRRLKSKRKSKGDKKLESREAEISVLKSTNFQSKLSVTCRENHLPWIGDDINEVPVTSNFIHRPHTSGSILSEINESQNNLRTMTLSTIQRLSDGTVIHKPKSEESPIVKKVTEVSPLKPSTNDKSVIIPTIPGTSSNNSKHKTKINETKAPQNLTSVSPFKWPKFKPMNYYDNLIKPTEIIHSPESKPLIERPKVHFSIPESTTSKISLEPCSSTSNSSDYRSKTKTFIYKILLKFYSKNKIDKKEFKHLKEKISEKILKKDHDTFLEEKVRAFVIRYLKFYFDKRNVGTSK